MNYAYNLRSNQQLFQCQMPSSEYYQENKALIDQFILKPPDPNSISDDLYALKVLTTIPVLFFLIIHPLFIREYILMNIHC